MLSPESAGWAFCNIIEHLPSEIERHVKKLVGYQWTDTIQGEKEMTFNQSTGKNKVIWEQKSKLWRNIIYKEGI